MDKKEIDIYDFDKTIVPFDSGTRFFAFCLLHYPWCAVVAPLLAAGLILMLLRVITFTQFKGFCFSFYPLVPKKRAVRKFWDRYEKKVNPWFLQRERYGVVISASPDFLLDEIANRLSFDCLICTRHNPRTGAIIGENCRGEEKVRRLYETVSPESVRVVDVYSDSFRHDKYIFALATGQCYHIENKKKIPFSYAEQYED